MSINRKGVSMKLSGASGGQDLVGNPRTGDLAVSNPVTTTSQELPEPLASSVSMVRLQAPASGGEVVYENPNKPLLIDTTNAHADEAAAMSPPDTKRSTNALESYLFFQTINARNETKLGFVHTALSSMRSEITSENKMVCSKCHADRLKEECKGDRAICEFNVPPVPLAI